MLMRAYQVHPCSWDKILDSIKENNHTLPSAAKTLYDTASRKQLKDRVSTKLGKLLLTHSEKIANLSLRLVTNIAVLIYDNL